MLLTNTLKGAVLASAVVGLLGTVMVAPARAADTSKMVKCAGVNECKGHGSCKSVSNACKGQNGCKGQGWMPTKTAEECKAKGGKVVEG
jgi:hypothetical protein